MFPREFKEGGFPDQDNIDTCYLQRRYEYYMKVREDLNKKKHSDQYI